MMKSFSLTILSLSLISMAHATSIEQYSLSNASSKPIAVIAPTPASTSATTTSTTTKASSDTALQSEIDRLKEQIKQQDNKIKQLNQAIQNNPSTSKAVATGPAATQTRNTTVNNATASKATASTTTADKKATTTNTASNTATATNKATVSNTTASKPTTTTPSKTTANTTASTAKATTVAKPTTPAKATSTTPTPAKANTTTAKATSTTATKANAVSDKTAYEAASKVYQQEGAAKAIAPMQEFIKNYPNSPLLPNAHFWLGEFNLSLTPPRILTAKTNFKAVVDKYPKSTLAPSALARLVEISQNIDKDPVQADIYQKQLLQKYPESKEAQREKKINQ